MSQVSSLPHIAPFHCGRELAMVPTTPTQQSPLPFNPSNYLKALRAQVTPVARGQVSCSIGPGPTSFYNPQLQYGKQPAATQRYYAPKPDPLFFSPRLPSFKTASPGAIYDVKAPSLTPRDFTKGPSRTFRARLHEEVPERESFMGLQQTSVTANVLSFLEHASLVNKSKGKFR